MRELKLLNLAGWSYEAVMAISLSLCLIILTMNNSSYVNQFDSLKITGLIGDSFAKIYSLYAELLTVAAQEEFGTIYYTEGSRSYMGLFVSFFMSTALNQTISEIEKINRDASYSNELSDSFERRDFAYLQGNKSIQ